MKSLRPFTTAAFVAGMVLIIPTGYYVFISAINNTFGHPLLFDAAYPPFERLVIKGSLAWNINLFLIFGPVAALMLNFSPVVRPFFRNLQRRIQ